MDIVSLTSHNFLESLRKYKNSRRAIRKTDCLYQEKKKAGADNYLVFVLLNTIGAAENSILDYIFGQNSVFWAKQSAPPPPKKNIHLMHFSNFVLCYCYFFKYIAQDWEKNGGRLIIGN